MPRRAQRTARAAGGTSPTPCPWVVADPPQGHRLPLGRVLELLGMSEAERPFERMLAFVRRIVPSAFICLVEHIDDDDTLQAHWLDEPRWADTVERGFLRPLAPLRRDRDAMALVARLASETDLSDSVFALQYSAADLPTAQEREFYRQSGLVARLSLLYSFAPGPVWALHVYRDTTRGGFRADEVIALAAVAKLLRLVHKTAHLVPLVAAEDIDVAEIRLGLRASSLSSREREVCARIAAGLTVKSIAQELGVAVSTVLTLRKRAYAKLGIHDRQSLSCLAG